MKQELEDEPRTDEEARRRKGPIPRNALFIAIALFIAVMLFYGPALIDAFHR